MFQPSNNRSLFCEIIALALIGLASASACKPKIGDDCILDRDCSQIGDRNCDTSQPGGYCTVFNCDPVSCPEDESVCVAFNNTPSTVPGCGNLGKTSPYARSFCMKTCRSDSDCRGSYICLDIAEENPWGADVIQKDPERTTVCVYPESAAAIPTGDGTGGRSNGVCQEAAGSLGGAGGQDGR
ncbi:MAG: hypothetical protein MK135_10465 [Polyangiaceae bacterium]|nr:hypothetical protein [Polyangiaceae bacterium]